MDAFWGTFETVYLTSNLYIQYYNATLALDSAMEGYVGWEYVKLNTQFYVGE